MNIKTLRDQLIIDEGMKLQVYLDHLGNPTFGIGHLLTKQDREWDLYYSLKPGQKLEVSLGRVEDVFKQDIEIVIKDCQKLFVGFNKMIEELQLILANMMFNLGLARLSKFKKFVKAVNEGNYKIAAKEMIESTWYQQVGNRAKRLVARMDKIANDSLCNVA